MTPALFLQACACPCTMFLTLAHTFGGPACFAFACFLHLQLQLFTHTRLLYDVFALMDQT
jgi:hypothetical protein